MILSDRSMCMVPYQGIGFPLFLPTSNKAFCEAQGREWKGGTLALHMLLSQKSDPRRSKSCNLIKMCKCVEFWKTLTPFVGLFPCFISFFGYGLSSPFFLFLFFFFLFSFLFFYLTLLSMYLFFCPYLFAKVIGESRNTHGAFVW
jgi:hypothetical protein